VASGFSENALPPGGVPGRRNQNRRLYGTCRYQAILRVQ